MKIMKNNNSRKLPLIGSRSADEKAWNKHEQMINGMIDHVINSTAIN